VKLWRAAALDAPGVGWSRALATFAEIVWTAAPWIRRFLTWARFGNLANLCGRPFLFSKKIPARLKRPTRRGHRPGTPMGFDEDG
jgi:hypothetical protein